MGRSESQSRAMHFSLTATTLMALAAVVVGAPPFTGAAHGTATLRAAHFMPSLSGSESRGTGDTPTVRAVAAAVAAAAREIIGGQPLAGALPAETNHDILPAPARAIARAGDVRHGGSERDRIGLRLLDLPPPIC